MRLFYSDLAQVRISGDWKHLYCQKRSYDLTADDILETVMILESEEDEE